MRRGVYILVSCAHSNTSLLVFVVFYVCDFYLLLLFRVCIIYLFHNIFSFFLGYRVWSLNILLVTL